MKLRKTDMEQGQHRIQYEFDGMDAGRLRLDERDVDKLLGPMMAKAAVKDALICHAHGLYVQPEKPYVRPQGRSGEYHGGRFIAMPAYVGPPIDAAGIKWIAGFPHNVERGLPRASAILMLNSLTTGAIIAEMECATLSARRTAAVAALCVDNLAVSGANEVALLGAGPVNQAVLEALLHGDTLPSRIRIFDPQSERVEIFRKGFRKGTRVPIVAMASAAACVKGAKVVIAATTGGKSYLERSWIEPGALLVMLSLDDPTPELFLSADKVVVDDFDQCVREEKLIHRLVRDGQFHRRQVHAELGEIIAGIKPGRAHDGEIILVNPMGMAIEDIAVGKGVFIAAKQQKVGQYCPPVDRTDLPPGFLFQPRWPEAARSR